MNDPTRWTVPLNNEMYSIVKNPLLSGTVLDLLVAVMWQPHNPVIVRKRGDQKDVRSVGCRGGNCANVVVERLLEGNCQICSYFSTLSKKKTSFLPLLINCKSPNSNIEIDYSILLVAKKALIYIQNALLWICSSAILELRLFSGSVCAVHTVPVYNYLLSIQGISVRL
jgi:hypothetical protein